MKTGAVKAWKVKDIGWILVCVINVLETTWNDNDCCLNISIDLEVEKIQGLINMASTKTLQKGWEKREEETPRG